MVIQETSLIYSLVCSILVLQTESARILALFPTPSISHQLVFRPITEELARRGHEVVVVTPDPAFPKGDAPPNLTEIDVHNISYHIWQQQLLNKDKTDRITEAERIFDVLIEIFNKQMKQAEFKKMIDDNDQRFDILLIETCMIPYLGLSHVFKAPVIRISSLGADYGNLESIGGPVHPILYPVLFRRRIYNLSIWETLQELYENNEFENFWYRYEKAGTNMLRKIFNEDFPSIDDLKTAVHMIFFNVPKIWEDNRPAPPSLVYLGGLHQKPQKELPVHLQQYLDKSTNGVIYMSLGTNVRLSVLPQERINMLFNVFEKTPYNILLKSDFEDMPGLPKNIKISQWFPQPDILLHPNVKLFITQAGLQSTDEAITARVPLIAFPLFVDQWYNAEKYVHHKIGMKFDMATVTDEELLNAISDIIGSNSYYENIRKLRSIITDQREQSLERAVWWIEYVIRHKGAAHLRSPAANMPWTETASLDVILILLLFVVASLLLLITTLYYAYKFLYKKVTKVHLKSCLSVKKSI